MAVVDNSNAVLNTHEGYGDDVIRTTEDPRDQVRERAPIYFGTDDIKGAVNAVMEIVTNSADELGAGYGDRVIVTVDSSYNITVSDNGRGVPMDWNPADNRYNWDCVYNTMFSSGKRGGGAYANAAGLNGVGAAITQFTALYMDVTSRRVEKVEQNGQVVTRYMRYDMHFENGYPKGELQRSTFDPKTEHTGTTVKFKTDPTCFQAVEFTPAMIIDKMRHLAMISGKAHYILRFYGMEEVDLFYDNGPVTFLEEVSDSRLTKDIIKLSDTRTGGETIRGKMVTLKTDIDLFFTFNQNGSMVETYHNNAFMIENGTSLDGFKDGVLSVLEGYARRTKLIQPKERLSILDVNDILVAVVSTKFDGLYSSFDGQEKKAIRNEFLEVLVEDVTKDLFTDWASSHSDEMDKIVKLVLANAEARKKAAEIRGAVIKKLSSGVNNYKTRPQKLVDCELKAIDGNEVYFVEGESAKGTTVQARSAKFQAVYPLTGKVLNCDKATIEAMLKNKVILDILQILGCGVEFKSKHIKDLPAFDISKLNYSKIIISTDADLDGWHIQCLLIVLFYVATPTLIKEGKIYIAEAPLYLFKYGTGRNAKAEYIYSDNEKAKRLEELSQLGYDIKKIEIKRFKGLGEMDSKQMAESTMNPDTRRLTKVEWPADVEDFERTMHELLGEDLASRKEWINDYFMVYGEDGESSEDEFVADVIDDTY